MSKFSLEDLRDIAVALSEDFRVHEGAITVRKHDRSAEGIIDDYEGQMVLLCGDYRDDNQDIPVATRCVIETLARHFGVEFTVEQIRALEL